MKEKLDTITLGAGCFWCIEAVFLRLKGVKSVEPGYMGGNTLNPTYEEVCTGNSGHAEVAKIVFDPSIISLKEILEVFWMTHDPTTVNRQGNDVGTQYRSAIFYNSTTQKEISVEMKVQLDNSGIFKAPIVTEVSPSSTFYPAEDYHVKYYDRNKNAPYCQFIVKPKVDKLKKLFASRVENP